MAILGILAFINAMKKSFAASPSISLDNFTYDSPSILLYNLAAPALDRYVQGGCAIIMSHRVCVCVPVLR